jgi:type IV pilus assembly protein PilV
MRMNRNISTRTCKRSNEKGFTLLEIIIAISILTFGILAVASMQVSSMRGNSFAGSVTEATALAGDRLERLIALSYDDSLLNDDNGNGSDGLNDTGDDADYDDIRVMDPVTYTVCTNLAIDTPRNNTKTIKVIVTWMDREFQKSVSLQHVKAR